jgi:predicted XRE-type DNA-binding protein
LRLKVWGRDAKDEEVSLQFTDDEGIALLAGGHVAAASAAADRYELMEALAGDQQQSCGRYRGMAQKQIAEALTVTQPSVSRALRPLLDLDLVGRTANGYKLSSTGIQVLADMRQKRAADAETGHEQFGE